MTGKRHCVCDKQTCFLCWQFYNDPRYNAIWGGTGIDQSKTWKRPNRAPIPKPIPEEERHRRQSVCLACEHWTAEGTGSTIPRCRLCGCVQGAACPLHKWHTRHLLFYLWPRKAHEAWRWNIEQLLQRWPLFTGRKVVAVSGRTRFISKSQIRMRPSTEVASLGEVQDAFGDKASEITWVTIGNNPHLWETAAWHQQWEQLADFAGPGDMTFYCHGKGVSRWDNFPPASKLWATMMYESCLDYLPVVEKLLQHFPMAGSFKKLVGMGRGSWHYAGTFWWVRNRDVLANYRNVDITWGGNEGWPGVVFPYDQGAVIFGEHAGNLYDYEHGKAQWQAWEQWKDQHRADKWPS